MKKLITLCLIGLLFLSECTKEKDYEYTGTLEITFTSNNAVQFSDFTIMIFTLENSTNSLYSGHPNEKGVFSKELLPGNYKANLYHNGGLYDYLIVQIINGQTNKLEVKY